MQFPANSLRAHHGGISFLSSARFSAWMLVIARSSVRRAYGIFFIKHFLPFGASTPHVCISRPFCQPSPMKKTPCKALVRNRHEGRNRELRLGVAAPGGAEFWRLPRGIPRKRRRAWEFSIVSGIHHVGLDRRTAMHSRNPESVVRSLVDGAHPIWMLSCGKKRGDTRQTHRVITRPCSKIGAQADLLPRQRPGLEFHTEE